MSNRIITLGFSPNGGLIENINKYGTVIASLKNYKELITDYESSIVIADRLIINTTAYKNMQQSELITSISDLKDFYKNNMEKRGTILIFLGVDVNVINTVNRACTDIKGILGRVMLSPKITYPEINEIVNENLDTLVFKYKKVEEIDKDTENVVEAIEQTVNDVLKFKSKEMETELKDNIEQPKRVNITNFDFIPDDLSNSNSDIGEKEVIKNTYYEQQDNEKSILNPSDYLETVDNLNSVLDKSTEITKNQTQINTINNINESHEKIEQDTMWVNSKNKNSDFNNKKDNKNIKIPLIDKFGVKNLKLKNREKPTLNVSQLNTIVNSINVIEEQKPNTSANNVYNTKEYTKTSYNINGSSTNSVRKVILMTGHRQSGVSYLTNLIGTYFKVNNNKNVLIVDLDFCSSTLVYDYGISQEGVFNKENPLKSIFNGNDINISEYITVLESGVNLFSFKGNMQFDKKVIGVLLYKIFKQGSYDIILLDTPINAIQHINSSILTTLNSIFVLEGSERGIRKGLSNLNPEYENINTLLLNIKYLINKGSTKVSENMILDICKDKAYLNKIETLGYIPEYNWDYTLKSFINNKSLNDLGTVVEKL